MRTKYLVVSGAAGVSPWLPMNTRQNPFSVSLSGTQTGTATWKVQHTFDAPENKQQCEISRSTTVATLRLVAHGLVVGDSVTVGSSGSTNLDGTYPVASVVDADNITYTVANSGATAAIPGVYVVVMRVFDHATLTAKSAAADGNYQFPVTATRLNVTAWTSGAVRLAVIQSRN